MFIERVSSERKRRANEYIIGIYSINSLQLCDLINQLSKSSVMHAFIILYGWCSPPSEARAKCARARKNGPGWFEWNAAVRKDDDKVIHVFSLYNSAFFVSTSVQRKCKQMAIENLCCRWRRCFSFAPVILFPFLFRHSEIRTM